MCVREGLAWMIKSGRGKIAGENLTESPCCACGFLEHFKVLHFAAEEQDLLGWELSHHSSSGWLRFVLFSQELHGNVCVS